MYMFAIDYTGN